MVVHIKTDHMKCDVKHTRKTNRSTLFLFMTEIGHKSFITGLLPATNYPDKSDIKAGVRRYQSEVRFHCKGVLQEDTPSSS